MHFAAHLACPATAFGTPVCRLGLAYRGTSVLHTDDVLLALESGVNFLNWPGRADYAGGADAFSAAISSLGQRREGVCVCVQFAARTAEEAALELPALLQALHTDYLDVVTFYYVEEREDWWALSGPGGALPYCRAAQRDGVIRRLGVTSHQRPLAAEMAQSGWLDVLMIRYNAAHPGAERELFPVTTSLRMPVIAYTAQRWGALTRPTPDDPAEFVVPVASEWYRFVLHSPAVSVVLTAPHDRAELERTLAILDSEPLTAGEHALLAEHGARVRRHAGKFP